jgi:hypothetical protein
MARRVVDLPAPLRILCRLTREIRQATENAALLPYVDHQPGTGPASPGRPLVRRRVSCGSLPARVRYTGQSP